jgi:hypothetical protein
VLLLPYYIPHHEAQQCVWLAHCCSACCHLQTYLSFYFVSGWVVLSNRILPVPVFLCLWQELKGNIRVFARVRPPSSSEMTAEGGSGALATEFPNSGEHTADNMRA